MAAHPRPVNEERFLIDETLLFIIQHVRDDIRNFNTLINYRCEIYLTRKKCPKPRMVPKHCKGAKSRKAMTRAAHARQHHCLFSLIPALKGLTQGTNDNRTTYILLNIYELKNNQVLQHVLKTEGVIT